MCFFVSPKLDIYLISHHAEKDCKYKLITLPFEGHGYLCSMLSLGNIYRVHTMYCFQMHQRAVRPFEVFGIDVRRQHNIT